MRLLPGFSLPLVLALLLIGTTPTGTGVGLHQFDLVHPLFAHVHIVNGHVLTHDQAQQGATTTSASGQHSAPAQVPVRVRLVSGSVRSCRCRCSV